MSVWTITQTFKSQSKEDFAYFKKKPLARTYITSFPGIVRLLNVVFGLLSLILILPGFANDYLDGELEELYRKGRKAHYKFTVDGRFDSFTYQHGAGYYNERQNVVQLICILICLVFSAIYLLFLVTISKYHYGSNREWNRFLNLSVSIIQGVGFLNGVFGVLLFRSYCCHVEFDSNERHKSELEGYFRKPCLCYFVPKWGDHAADSSEYTTLWYKDAPTELNFHSALPHHFIPHTISLCFMGINILMYICASIQP